MKKILKYILLFSFALVAQNQFWQNITFSRGVETLILTAAILTIFDLFIKPIVKLLLLPINLLTLGLIRFIINTLGLYLAAFLIPDIYINPINLPSSQLYGLHLPPFHFIGFWSFLVNSISISLCLSFFKLLIKSSKIKK